MSWLPKRNNMFICCKYKDIDTVDTYSPFKCVSPEIDDVTVNSTDDENDKPVVKYVTVKNNKWVEPTVEGDYCGSPVCAVCIVSKKMTELAKATEVVQESKYNPFNGSWLNKSAHSHEDCGSPLCPVCMVNKLITKSVALTKTKSITNKGMVPETDDVTVNSSDDEEQEQQVLISKPVKKADTRNRIKMTETVQGDYGSISPQYPNCMANKQVTIVIETADYEESNTENDLQISPPIYNGSSDNVTRSPTENVEKNSTHENCGSPRCPVCLVSKKVTDLSEATENAQKAVYNHFGSSEKAAQHSPYEYCDSPICPVCLVHKKIVA